MPPSDASDIEDKHADYVLQLVDELNRLRMERAEVIARLTFALDWIHGIVTKLEAGGRSESVRLPSENGREAK